jgi:hypothetical protein
VRAPRRCKRQQPNLIFSFESKKEKNNNKQFTIFSLYQSLLLNNLHFYLFVFFLINNSHFYICLLFYNQLTFLSLCLCNNLFSYSELNNVDEIATSSSFKSAAKGSCAHSEIDFAFLAPENASEIEPLIFKIVGNPSTFENKIIFV